MRGSTDQKLLKSFAEIHKYIATQKGISYYDLVAYSYDNDKDDWIFALDDRKMRRTISLYLKSKRHRDGTKYNHSLEESMSYAMDAKVRYEIRKEKTKLAQKEMYQ